MSLIVQKFGGTSVANAKLIFSAAKKAIKDYKKGNNVIVVVSAQGDTTDKLIEKAKEINKNPSKRELDVLLSSGEQMSAALMAMAIKGNRMAVTRSPTVLPRISPSRFTTLIRQSRSVIL